MEKKMSFLGIRIWSNQICKKFENVSAAVSLEIQQSLHPSPYLLDS